MGHSVADPECLSRIPDPDFYPSRIPDLGFRIQKQQQKRGVKKNCGHTYFCSHKFHKTLIFTQKIVISSHKYGFGIRDPRPGNREVKKAPDPGRIQGSKKHRIPHPHTASGPALHVSF